MDDILINCLWIFVKILHIRVRLTTYILSKLTSAAVRRLMAPVRWRKPMSYGGDLKIECFTQQNF